MTFVGKSDIGLVRSSNQDSFAVKTFSPSVGVAVLCDGMGGHKGGKVAGQLACFTAINYIEDYCNDFGIPENPESILKEAVTKANGAVFAQSLKNAEYRGMGSTLVILFVKDNVSYICHVGDSRVYLLRGGEIFRLTKDHSVVQELIDKNEITEEEIEDHPLKNVITRAVGNPENIVGDFMKKEIEKGDVFLLCSDGLSSYVGEKEFSDIINLYGVTDDCCEKLISTANGKGGQDNVTVVLFTNDD